MGADRDGRVFAVDLSLLFPLPLHFLFSGGSHGYTFSNGAGPRCRGHVRASRPTLASDLDASVLVQMPALRHHDLDRMGEMLMHDGAMQTRMIKKKHSRIPYAPLSRYALFVFLANRIAVCNSTTVLFMISSCIVRLCAKRKSIHGVSVPGRRSALNPWAI